MNQTRKTWVSAAVVGVVLVGGVSVAAAASAGGIDQARRDQGRESRARRRPPVQSGRRPGTSSRPPRTASWCPRSSSRPGQVVGYWTDDRLEERAADADARGQGPVNIDRIAPSRIIKGRAI